MHNPSSILPLLSAGQCNPGVIIFLRTLELIKKSQIWEHTYIFLHYNPLLEIYFWSITLDG